MRKGGFKRFRLPAVLRKISLAMIFLGLIAMGYSVGERLFGDLSDFDYWWVILGAGCFSLAFSPVPFVVANTLEAKKTGKT